MTITIRIERTELDPQGLKELLAMMCDACHYVLSEHPWEPKHKEIDDIDTSKSRPDWCPLVPLPEKHGRLIDATEATRRSLERTGKRLLAIDTAPTVVEAEGDDG